MFTILRKTDDNKDHVMVLIVNGADMPAIYLKKKDAVNVIKEFYQPRPEDYIVKKVLLYIS